MNPPKRLLFQLLAWLMLGVVLVYLRYEKWSESRKTYGGRPSMRKNKTGSFLHRNAR